MTVEYLEITNFLDYRLLYSPPPPPLLRFVFCSESLFIMYGFIDVGSTVTNDYNDCYH